MAERGRYHHLTIKKMMMKKAIENGQAWYFSWSAPSPLPSGTKAQCGKSGAICFKPGSVRQPKRRIDASISHSPASSSSTTGNEQP